MDWKICIAFQKLPLKNHNRTRHIRVLASRALRNIDEEKKRTNGKEELPIIKNRRL